MWSVPSIPVAVLQVAFFQKVLLVFQISKSPKKKFQKTILNLKFKIPDQNNIILWARILNFKFMIVFWNIFSFGDLKNQSRFLKKKPPLAPADKKGKV